MLILCVVFEHLNRFLAQVNRILLHYVAHPAQPHHVSSVHDYPLYDDEKTIKRVTLVEVVLIFLA